MQIAVNTIINRSVEVLCCILELGAGHSSQGFPQAPRREQQQDARVTPTPISALQEIPPSPRVRISRKQLPTRVSKKDTYSLMNIWSFYFCVTGQSLRMKRICGLTYCILHLLLVTRFSYLIYTNALILLLVLELDDLYLIIT